MENVEIWKPIKGFEGLYEVSNYGRVRSVDRFIEDKNQYGIYKKFLSGKILSPSKDKFGYYRIKLLGKPCKVHRLVAEAFIPNQDNLPCVNHKDENPSNNNVDNLEWCTQKYNTNYGNRNKKIRNKLSRNVICLETGTIYQSAIEVERLTGLYASNICRCCLGKYKSYLGLHWKYI